MTARIELDGGPERSTMYITSLYFTMTCMTSIGFGNVAPETDNEKVFTICMMVIGGKPSSSSFFGYPFSLISYVVRQCKLNYRSARTSLLLDHVAWKDEPKAKKKLNANIERKGRKRHNLDGCAWYSPLDNDYDASTLANWTICLVCVCVLSRTNKYTNTRFNPKWFSVS